MQPVVRKLSQWLEIVRPANSEKAFNNWALIFTLFLQGCVITRSRAKAIDVWEMKKTGHPWYILETNYDHWELPPKGDDRRDPAIKAMNETTRAGLNATSLFKVMSTPPVLNNATTYTVIMSAAKPEVYNTWVRHYVGN